MKKTILNLALIATFFVASNSFGQLTYIETQYSTATAGGTSSTRGSYGVCVSPDDQNVYTTNYSTSGSCYRGIVSFDINGDGSLTQIQALRDNGETGGTIPNIYQARLLNVSPDGKNVYVAVSGDDAVKWFDRNTTTGMLSDGGGYS